MSKFNNNITSGLNFEDASDGTADIEVTLSESGNFLVLNVNTDEHGGVGINLSPEQVNSLRHYLSRVLSV